METLSAMPFLEWIVLLGAVVTAVTLIWTKIIRPVARAIVLIETHVPTLVDIASEFKNNGGSTLKDEIDALQTMVMERKRWDEDLEAYMHARFHDLINAINAVRLKMEMSPMQLTEFMGRNGHGNGHGHEHEDSEMSIRETEG